MIRLKIDDINYVIKDIENYQDMTIFQYLYNLRITLPCFCYHERLSIAGNCRMCLVQVGNGLGVACALNLADNMSIYTNNIRVKEAREAVLEFLLSNHL